MAKTIVLNKAFSQSRSGEESGFSDFNPFQSGGEGGGGGLAASMKDRKKRKVRPLAFHVLHFDS
jgi:hypothetical protein